jgi:hypothetical protein
MLHDRDAIADADAKRPPGTAFADYDAYNRRSQPAHFEHAFSDYLGLSAFLGTDSGKGPWRVDEAHQRQVILLRDSHFTHRFPITFRVSAAEMTSRSLFVRAAFLMPQDKHFEAIEFSETGKHGTVVAEMFVTMKFDKVIEGKVQIVARVRSIFVPRDLNGLPRAELTICIAKLGEEFAAQSTNLDLNGLTSVSLTFQRRDPYFKFRDLRLKF